jgi:hypothetical protein
MDHLGENIYLFENVALFKDVYFTESQFSGSLHFLNETVLGKDILQTVSEFGEPFDIDKGWLSNGYKRARQQQFVLDHLFKINYICDL